jgi:DNA-binding GntR family transcriptional regulator
MAYESTTDTDGGAGAGAVVLDGRTLRERVYDYIRDEILAERLAPGSELQEVALAQSLGVSRGPVREALGRLEAAGLVTIRPRRGAVVRSLSAREFLEAYQLREALEVMAVRLAVPRLEEGGFARLEALIDRTRTARCASTSIATGFARSSSAGTSSARSASTRRSCVLPVSATRRVQPSSWPSTSASRRCG